MKSTADREPSSEEIKEVYAHFGLAYYLAEVLHRGLCNLYSLSRLPAKGPITRPRAEEHLRTAFETTMGQILQHLKPTLSDALIEKLEVALQRRNFNAHHFWYDRVHLMTTLEGIASMTDELTEASELFSEIDVEVEKIIGPLMRRVGVTPELLSEAQADVLRGGHLEPLNQQRRPKRDELVVEVFEVPAASGGADLVFLTDDGLLWQLCDAGLGWTAYDKRDPSWQVAAKFSPLLPAKVSPRPIVANPWNYEISFGSRHTLVFITGKVPGQVLWRLRTNNPTSRR